MKDPRVSWLGIKFWVWGGVAMCVHFNKVQKRGREEACGCDFFTILFVNGKTNMENNKKSFFGIVDSMIHKGCFMESMMEDREKVLRG